MWHIDLVIMEFFHHVAGEDTERKNEIAKH